jgi:hypothetical protein
MQTTIVETRTQSTCNKCGHQWLKRKHNKTPTRCPSCHTFLWDRDRKIRPSFFPRGENYDKVIELRRASPCATLQEIGDKVGLSRERVRQILAKEELSTNHCVVNRDCSECGKHIRSNNKTGMCDDCLYKMNAIPLVCSNENCGKLFYRRKYIILRNVRRYPGKYVFCSKKCQGEHLSKHSGFNSHHPVPFMPRKTNTLSIRHLTRLGFTAKEIRGFTNLPLRTIYHARLHYSHGDSGW